MISNKFFLDNKTNRTGTPQIDIDMALIFKIQLFNL